MFDLTGLLRPAVVAPALIILYLFYQICLKPDSLPHLPALNARDEWFSLVRARWRNVLHFQDACRLAHSKYRDQTIKIPMLGQGNVVLIPAKYTGWVTEQPASSLNLHRHAIEILQTDWTFEPKLMRRQPVQDHISKTTLTSELPNIIPILGNEAQFCIDEIYGTNQNEWREVVVFKSLEQFVSRVTNRVFVGDLCRNPEIIRIGIAWAATVPPGAALMHLFPSSLKNIVAPLVLRGNQRLKKEWLRIVEPVVKQRLSDYDERKRGKAVGPEPQDFLQWVVNHARESGDPYFNEPRTIALRGLILQFAQIRTSTIVCAHALLDLVSSKKEYLDEIREEVRTALAEHGGWTHEAVASMVRVNSVFRETIRLNSFAMIGMQRIVTAKDGITTPDGYHLPHGSNTAVPAYTVHHDPEIYPNPSEFQPFRFSDLEKGGSLADKDALHAERVREDWATTTTTWLGFGHGRTACPGRFFAAAELKVLLACMVLQYDFEMLPERPANLQFGHSCVPSRTATVKVRRRKEQLY